MNKIIPKYSYRKYLHVLLKPYTCNLYNICSAEALHVKVIFLLIESHKMFDKAHSSK
jgi:hypothetical protein